MPIRQIQSGPTINILIGALFISFSGVWVAWSGVHPTVSAFYRVFFGTAFLAIACLWKHEIHPVSAKTLSLSVLCGLCFAADLYCWHASILFVGPGLATILGNFQVFVLALVSFIFFAQPIRPLFLLSLPLAIIGLFLVVGFDWSTLQSDYRNGIYLGLATAIFYSGFLLSLRKIQQSQEGISFFLGLTIVSAVSSAFLAIFILTAGLSFSLSSPASWGSLICLALFSQTIGWAFISNSLPKCIPSVAGLILLLQPLLSFIWDVTIFQRPTTLLHWLGVFVTLTAIYLGMSATPKKG